MRKISPGRKNAGLLLCCFLTILFSSCRPSNDTSEGQSSPTSRKTVVGAVIFGRDSFFENVQRGMEAAAGESAAELLVNIHDHDINKETGLIEDYIARKVDTLVITPESPKASIASIKQAHEAGIKIVCFNTCIDRIELPKYVSTFYETDQSSLGYQTGEYLAGWAARNLAGQELVIGILQCERFDSCKRRGDGFRKALSDKGVRWREAANQEGFMPDEGSAVAESMLQADPKINILWAENEGGTAGEVIAVRSMNLQGKVHVFGTDISPQLAEMLLHEENILQAVTGQSPYKMGYDAVHAALQVDKGEKVEPYHIVENAFYSREQPEDARKYLQEYRK